MTPCIRPLSLVLTLAAASLSGQTLAFSFKDVEKLEAAEQQELLGLARQAAARQDFSQARKFIEQARHKGYNPKAIEAAESTYRREYAAYEEQRRREEAQRQAAQQASRPGGSARTIVSGLGGSFAGHCPSSGYHDRARYNVRLSNGGNATVVVRCEMGCWNIAVFDSLPSNPGTNCGDFSRDSWHASQGMLHRPGADLQGVTHWLLGN